MRSGGILLCIRRLTKNIFGLVTLIDIGTGHGRAYNLVIEFRNMIDSFEYNENAIHLISPQNHKCCF